MMSVPISRYHPKTVPGRIMLIMACVFGVLAFCCWLFNMIWPSPILLGLIYGMQDGQPAVAQRSFIPPGKLTDIAVNDDSLFLLYATPGIVNAYSHDGEYQYSILFPYESNGSASLFASGSDLYYCNRWEKVFHVHDGAYRQVWEHEAGDEKLAELQEADPTHRDDVCWHGGMRYEISGQNVNRVSPDGAVKQIVNGPELLGQLEFRRVWFAGMLSFVLAMALFVWTIRLDRKLSKKQA